MFQFEQNMLIEGDSLNGLKLIEGMVDYDLILIDPPHRAEKDSEMNLTGVREDEWSIHLKERLKKAHSLLKKDGTIAIHIDEGEYAYLRLVMDEVFGKSNYVNTFILKKGSMSHNRTSRRDISLDNTFEFLVIYKRSHEFYYKNPQRAYMEERKSGHGRVRKETTDGSTESHRKALAFKDHWTQFTRACDAKVVNASDRVRRTNNTPHFWVKSSDSIRMDINLMTYDKDANSTGRMNAVKRLDAVKDIISLFTDENSRILDFYARSGTTAHAVMELNREDGGKRQFTLMTNNEKNLCKPRINEVARANGETYEYIVIG